MNGRCIVIQHEADAPPGLLRQAAEQAGVALAVYHPFRGESLPDRVEPGQGLVVLGGGMGAYDDARYGWLTGTKRLIARAVTDERPFFGICLGHQLAAVALGGQVRIDGRGPTAGVVPVTRTDEGRADALLSAVEDGAAAVHWNRDIVTALPPGATLLAADVCGRPQVVRHGPAAWSFQGHPEVTPDVVDAWVANVLRRGRSVDDPPDPAAIAADVRAHEERLRQWWLPLFTGFLARLHH